MKQKRAIMKLVRDAGFKNFDFESVDNAIALKIQPRATKAQPIIKIIVVIDIIFKFQINFSLVSFKNSFKYCLI